MCQHQQQAGTPYPNSTVFSLIRSSAHTQNPPKPPHQRKMRHNWSILARRHLSTGICQEPSPLQLPKSSWSPNKTSHGTRLCSRIDAASADSSQQHPLAAPSREGVWVPKAPPAAPTGMHAAGLPSGRSRLHHRKRNWQPALLIA